jgi:gp16 family phage-associated protein
MRTAQQVKQDFRRQGLSVATWARANRFNVWTVYRVLDGTLKCNYGVSHEIAVALGLKEAPKVKATLSH